MADTDVKHATQMKWADEDVDLPPRSKRKEVSDFQGVAVTSIANLEVLTIKHPNFPKHEV